MHASGSGGELAAPWARLGDTFLVSQTGNHPNHLWVLAGGPADCGSFAAFSLTTPHARTLDRSCILNPNDHPFVRHETVIDYARGKLINEAGYKALREFGCCNTHVQFSMAILRRIQKGALDSEFTPQYLQDIVRARLLS